MNFDWDDGNRTKCQRHGVSVDTIEAVLSGEPYIGPDPYLGIETRFRAIGETSDDRHVFIVFTFREQDGDLAIRPISARYMHTKEVRKHEQDRKA